MEVYGNKTWNNATDNRDKTLVPMAEETFKKIQEQLENSGINYFAYSKDSKTVMAVNDKDLDCQVHCRQGCRQNGNKKI